jgi:hypothetical protein
MVGMARSVQAVWHRLSTHLQPSPSTTQYSPFVSRQQRRNDQPRAADARSGFREAHPNSVGSRTSCDPERPLRRQLFHLFRTGLPLALYQGRVSAAKRKCNRPHETGSARGWVILRHLRRKEIWRSWFLLHTP